MTRNQFLKLCIVSGIGIPFNNLLTSCGKGKSTFEGNVLIIGAGAAGMTAAYLLNKAGISVTILEASYRYGGRIKVDKNFTDFPIPLGAEWLHTNPNFFNSIIGDSSVDIDLIDYPNNEPYAIWENNQLIFDELGDYNDLKFLNATWLDFFEDYIVPSIQDSIIYNNQVTSIDYTNDKVKVVSSQSQYEADKVIVTVPLNVLKNQVIQFSPTLPTYKLNAIQSANNWSGIKVFIEFSQQFYPSFTELLDVPAQQGQVAYFDAAYGQNTNHHVLGLFAVGQAAETYINLQGAALINHILAELDTIFSLQTSGLYIKHIVQNWNDEAFQGAAYISDYANWKTVRDLHKSVDDKIYFAGEAYTSGEDWGSVHTAAEAAMEVVSEIVDG